MNSTFIPVCFSRYLPSGANLRWSSVGASSGIAETLRTDCGCPCARPPKTVATTATNALFKTTQKIRRIRETPFLKSFSSLHSHQWPTCNHLPDHGSVRETIAAEHRQHFGDHLLDARDQKPAARLRIGQQRFFNRCDIRAELDVTPVRSPVAARSAGDESLGCHGLHP